MSALFSPLPSGNLSVRVGSASARICTPLSTSYLLTDARKRGPQPFQRTQSYAHAQNYYNPARNMLYARFSTDDWYRSNNANYASAEQENSSSERFRAHAWRSVKDIDARTRNRQNEATRKLEERAHELHTWKSELNAEVNAMQTESANLKEYRRVMEKAFVDSVNSLHVAEECLLAREKRQGIDQVHDCAEKALIKEVNVIRKCQENMKRLLQRASVQLKLNRAAQDSCESDSKDKHQAEYTDDKLQQLRNSSAAIGFYPGVEAVDNTISVPESWKQFSTDNILRSQTERAASEKLRSDMENCLRASSNELWSNFCNVNNNLKTRIQQTSDARSRLQANLVRTMQEIYDMEKQIQLMRKTLVDLEMPLKVSQTRLQERTTRPNVESCHDYAMSTLQKEAHELRESMRYLKEKLRLAQAAMARLQKNRAMLNHDISVKDNSLYIDQKMCLGMRKNLPTDSKVGPIFQMPIES